MLTDIADVRQRCNHLLRAQVIDLRPGSPSRSPAAAGPIDGEELDLLDDRPFGSEFLPGWYEEWVLVERERMRQLCLHALESIAARRAEHHMYGAAIQALLASIALDELRESPRRMMMAIHIAEGNPTEAIRHFDDYVLLLDRAMGLAPSAEMQQLAARVRDSSRPRRQQA
jgi:DNA-binding SARP family transcriptional activator